MYLQCWDKCAYWHHSLHLQVYGDNVVSGLPLVIDCEACGLAKLEQHAELLLDSFLKKKQF
jgi:hypothetical protein